MQEKFKKNQVMYNIITIIIAKLSICIHKYSILLFYMVVFLIIL